MLSPVEEMISHAYRMDEVKCLNNLLDEISFSLDEVQRIEDKARTLIYKVRQARKEKGGVNALLHTYDLSSEEGIALMCLAEALLRIPDKATRDRFIRDKIANKDWRGHLKRENTWFVNAATWTLILTGKVLGMEKSDPSYWLSVIKHLAKKTGEPLVREAVAKAMQLLGRQFVMGETIEEALERAQSVEGQHYRYSFDMLGEAAKTAEDAHHYFTLYQSAIEAIAKTNTGLGPIEGHGISVKLSALHPRYEWAKKERILAELLPRLKLLALQAKRANIGFTIDAEEATQLVLSLLLFEALAKAPELTGWQGLGLAVQAYQKRATFVIDWLIELARTLKRRFILRLVKGAYWDSEIKWTQERGLSNYPVFTRKTSTDVSYLVCVKKILAATDAFFPQFATHNAYTVAAVLEMTKGYQEFEFQCLHGMGDTLYDHLVQDGSLNIHCRVYAPVGGHEHLLAYLVRRLLENGANTSFVNRIVDEKVSLDALVADPILKTKQLSQKSHPLIPLPINLYGAARLNSPGVDVSNDTEVKPLLKKINYYLPHLLDSEVASTSPEQIETLLVEGSLAAIAWNRTSLEKRAEYLLRMANLLEENQAHLLALLVREGGKTIPDAVSEWREAIDFCRYYSYHCRKDLKVRHLPGPTGEHNRLELHGRGVIICISPWNFPLAIFLGQITAALAAGNVVIAKPASQTPFIAAKVIDLLHQAGIPRKAVQLIVGKGSMMGDQLLQDKRIQGVMFTGSTATARHINQQLAARLGPIIPFIAETGGQNAMIVDSSALPEQVVADIIASAFNSAGQRCSALRILFLQEEVAPRMLTMLKGAMAELAIGDPLDLATDIGPLIDENAQKKLLQHVDCMDQKAKLIYECVLPESLPSLPRGAFFAPRVYEIENLDILTEEVFGPILHVIRYKSQDLKKIIAMINNTGYGLTLGIHSRIDETVEYIHDRVRVGNTYVNRNMIGAVVGVQPFGGEGLSGTGPKAGGPHMLPRLSIERTFTVNTAAAGGNVTLMSLQEE